MMVIVIYLSSGFAKGEEGRELTDWVALLSAKVLLVNSDCLGKVIEKGALKHVWIDINHGGEAKRSLNGSTKRGDLDFGDEDDSLDRNKETKSIGRLTPAAKKPNEQGEGVKANERKPGIS